MNKVYFSIILCLCITLTTSAQSRKRKTAARKTVKKEVKQEPVEESPAAMLYASMLPSTAKIMFVDSIVVPKDSFLAKIPLNKESGYIADYRQLFPHADAPQVLSSAYINEFGDQIYFSIGNTLKARNLYKMDLLGDKWGPKTPVEGIDTIYKEVNFPFMMSDGITLFFAAKGEESVGGYDIFTTLFDSETGKFFQPENYGLPFNSPANDYMYAVDEYNNLGWFATDRNQPEGKVCVYTFIPNPTRRLYSMEEMDSREIGRRARITSIRDTRTEPQVVKQAQSVLASLSSTNKQTVRKGDFEFVLSDARTCVLEADFKNPEARQQLKWWLENRQSLTQTESRLSALRDEYAAADADRKNQLAPQIRLLEGKLVQTLADLHTTEKNIRRLELGQE